MRQRKRVLFALVTSAVCASACESVLGIHDLSDPAHDAGAGSDAAADGSAASDATAAPDVDAAAVADAEAGTGGDAGIPLCDTDADPCMVVIQPDGGPQYPTWAVTSDLQVQATPGQGFASPIAPQYQDAGAGTLMEMNSGLTWQTSLPDAGPIFDLASAAAYCTGLGSPWRVPTRVEIATTQHRDEPDGGQTTCIPPQFDQGGSAFVWSASRVPAAGSQYFVEEETSCGFVPGASNASYSVRCVKGTPKPATFVVSRKNDSVWAVETMLEWERTGAMVHGLAEAQTHCKNLNGMGWRIPVIQEVYGIIDERRQNNFDPALFSFPDAGTIHMVFSQTLLAGNSGAPVWEGVGPDSPDFGIEESSGDPDPSADLLIRCVRPRMN